MLKLWQCPECHRRQFPERLRCTYCTAGPLQAVVAEPEAVIEEATVVERAFGLAPNERLYLATVRHVDSGARLIARLSRAAEVGASVRLEELADGAIWAWPAETSSRAEEV